MMFSKNRYELGSNVFHRRNRIYGGHFGFLSFDFRFIETHYIQSFQILLSNVYIFNMCFPFFSRLLHNTIRFLTHYFTIFDANDRYLLGKR